MERDIKGSSRNLSNKWFRTCEQHQIGQAKEFIIHKFMNMSDSSQCYNLSKFKFVPILQGTSTAECIDQVPASSLFRDSHCAGKWQGTSITCKNQNCHRTCSGGLKWQREVHKGIECNRDFMALRANQSRLVLAL